VTEQDVLHRCRITVTMGNMAWDKLPWGTMLGGLIVLLVAGVGGVIVIGWPETLSFQEYVNALSDLAVGVGLVTVGRGVAKAGKHVAKDDASR
jgi:hypothetical protein